MEFTIVWGGDPEDVSVVTSGDATAEALSAYSGAVLADPNYRPGLRVLVDHRRADLSRLTSDAYARRAEQFARDRVDADGHRIAYVVASTVDFGVTRMAQGLAGGKLDAEMDWRVFRDIDQAREWLGESGA